MKPLLAKDLPNFLSRFGNFVDAEIRSINVLSPTTIKIVIACQDTRRGFDWLTISLEYYNIIDTKLIENTKLPLVNMSDGVSLVYEDGSYAFGVGKYNNLSGIKSAVSYIISSTLKYEEGLF